MGGVCCESPLGNFQDNIILILKEALVHQPGISPKELSQIIEIVAEGCPKELDIQNYSVFLQNKKPQSSRLLLAKKDKPKEGLIIYNDSYYSGEIRSKTAHSEGTLYMMPAITQSRVAIPEYIVRGFWEEDNFKRGSVSEINRGESEQQICKIQLNGEEIVISFGTGDMQSFRGRAKWTKLSPNSTKFTISGEGKIIFRNGSVYQGTIKNGLLDTQGERSAVFTTQDETQIYEGPYKQGFRDGEGLLTVKEPLTMYTCSMTWNRGVPDLQSLRLENRGPRMTLLRSKKSSTQ